MAKNGSITSFFKPVSQSTQSSQTGRARAAPSPTPPPPSLPPLPSSSPLPPALFLSSSPPAPTSTVRDRNAVIKGSDDEDGDDFSSDDEFPDLFLKPADSTLPVQPAREKTNIYATPKAKRRVLEFHSSPLTNNAKHKYDMKALLLDAAADNAIEASEQRTAALLAQGSPTTRGGGVASGAQASLDDTLLSILSDAEGSQDEGNREKLLRAVKRTEATVGRKEWYFFDGQDGLPSNTGIEVRLAFPKAQATGAWAFLADERHRAEAFEDGLPYHVQCRMQDLPDEIFQWIVDEAPREKSKHLRDEYVRLLSVCPDQIGRLMDQDLVVKLFRNLGASEQAVATGSHPSSERGAPYSEQGRTRLEIVLRILTETAHALKIGPLTRTMAILLRLGIDNVVRDDQAIAAEFQNALLQVALAVPWRSWNNFCGHAGDSVYSLAQDATLRWKAVSSIPLLHPKLVDLRRRLALIFVFDDVRRGFSPPQDTFSIRSVIDRLDQADEFIVDRSNTDYFELLALGEMLSVAVGDGSPPADDTSSEATKHYNAEVDELAHRVKFMWSNIHEQGAAYMSRLEARVQLRDFERKLQHVVRTRPPPKEDIFGLNAVEEEAERPKQQQFMQRFLSKPEPPYPKTP
ncbi:hypothetical protein N657DRAFT_570266 [Parathielavia appendiculata]|uniref:Uncharacterized protein n=1 Tax=Parathielavia appendiculata TaxID=2587402 RepID=A0AAN6U2X2_9PEZI|nr:hypothetical protein N657DRAFT_570266 [Parathielavia appendiculata]